MKNPASFLCALLTALTITSIVRGEPCSQEYANAFAQKKGLWALSSPSEAAPANVLGVSAKHLSAASVLDAARFDRFVYVGRQTTPKEDVEGAIAVKIERLATADDTPARTVVLRRSYYSSICRPFLDFELFWLPFPVGVEETVSQYAMYHVTNRNVSSKVQKFHIWYKSLKDDCVRSDSAVGQRRSGFLTTYDGDPLDPGSETIAWVGNQIATPAFAGSAPSASTKGIVVRINAEIDHLKKFSHIETQVISYPIANRVCVVIRPESQLSGSSSLVEITDLDSDRGQRRMNPWSIRWQ